MQNSSSPFALDAIFALMQNSFDPPLRRRNFLHWMQNSPVT